MFLSLEQGLVLEPRQVHACWVVGFDDNRVAEMPSFVMVKVYIHKGWAERYAKKMNAKYPGIGYFVQLVDGTKDELESKLTGEYDGKIYPHSYLYGHFKK